MAEIVRTETRVRRSHTNGDDTEPTTRTQVRTTVRSIHGRDASVIRDFVKALDAADAPGTALVEHRRTAEGHLCGLVAEWTQQLDGEAVDPTP